MNLPFYKTSEFYNLLYKDKSTQKEVDYVENLFKLKEGGVKTILEFGCETGRHSKLFAKRGFLIHGVELSKSMLNQIDKIKGFTFQQGDITKIRIDKKFDAVISLFHVISYLNTNNQLKNVFNNANNHLVDGGIFLFDIWYSAGVISEKPSTRLKKFTNGDIEINRIAVPNIDYLNNIVEINYTFFVNNLSTKTTKTFDEKHRMRYFSIPEIDHYASLFGFKRLISEEWLTKNIPSERTWGLCLVYKKI